MPPEGPAAGKTPSVGGRPLDDTELVKRARRGDADAYEDLVRRHQSVARRTAYVVCGSWADADDACQDGFVKAWTALPRFREDAPFRPWVLQIVANEARNRRRSAGRRAELAVRAAGVGSDPGWFDGPRSPEEAALEAERHRGLVTALHTLCDRDQQVVACRYLVGLSEAETAAALGWPAGTVKSRLSRALGRLRTALGPNVTAGGAA